MSRVSRVPDDMSKHGHSAVYEPGTKTKSLVQVQRLISTATRESPLILSFPTNDPQKA